MTDLVALGLPLPPLVVVAAAEDMVGLFRVWDLKRLLVSVGEVRELEQMRDCSEERWVGLNL